jgi:hypothetical protein
MHNEQERLKNARLAKRDSMMELIDTNSETIARNGSLYFKIWHFHFCSLCSDRYSHHGFFRRFLWGGTFLITDSRLFVLTVRPPFRNFFL